MAMWLMDSQNHNFAAERSFLDIVVESHHLAYPQPVIAALADQYQILVDIDYVCLKIDNDKFAYCKSDIPY